MLESFRPSRPERFSRGTTSLAARLPGVSLRGAARCARARAAGAAFPRPSLSRHRRRGRVPVPERLVGSACRPPRTRRPRAPTVVARPSSPRPRVGLQPERRRSEPACCDAPGRGQPQVFSCRRGRATSSRRSRRGVSECCSVVRAGRSYSRVVAAVVVGAFEDLVHLEDLASASVTASGLRSVSRDDARALLRLATRAASGTGDYLELVPQLEEGVRLQRTARRARAPPSRNGARRGRQGETQAARLRSCEGPYATPRRQRYAGTAPQLSTRRRARAPCAGRGGAALQQRRHGEVPELQVVERERLDAAGVPRRAVVRVQADALKAAGLLRLFRGGPFTVFVPTRPPCGGARSRGSGSPRKTCSRPGGD